MTKLLIMMTSLVILASCTDTPNAIKVLENQGYTNIEITGYNMFACSENDAYHTGFKAVKNNIVITGTVCSGFLFKNSTIRFD